MEDDHYREVGGSLFPFIRCLAHDMATPLLTVLGYSQMLLSDLEGQQMEDVQVIEASAQRLRSLLALLSRLSRFLPEENSCSAHEFCEDLKFLVLSAATGGRCRVNWEEEGLEQGGELPYNPWKIRAAALNLMSCLLKNDSLLVKMARSPEQLKLVLKSDAPPYETCTRASRGLESAGASVKRIDETTVIVALAIHES